MNSDTVPSRRIRPDRFDVVVGIASLLALAFLLRLGLGLTFFADEWSIIADRVVTIDDLLRQNPPDWLLALQPKR